MGDFPCAFRVGLVDFGGGWGLVWGHWIGLLAGYFRSPFHGRVFLGLFYLSGGREGCFGRVFFLRGAYFGIFGFWQSLHFFYLGDLGLDWVLQYDLRGREGRVGFSCAAFGGFLGWGFGEYRKFRRDFFARVYFNVKFVVRRRVRGSDMFCRELPYL